MADILPLAVRRYVRSHASIVAAAIAVLLLTFIATFAQPAVASKSLVTVYADGNERVISTTVLTVGEALERAGIELNEHDLVEPGLDTFINEAIFRINVYRARPITIVDGNSQKTVMSPYKSPRLIAEAAGYEVHDEDQFEFELIDDILLTGAIGERLKIDRATPVTISLYGDQIVHRTHVDTVSAVLDEAGIVLGASDTLKQPLDQSVSADQPILVVREGTDILTEETPVAYETEYIYDANMFAGQREVQVPGQNGVEHITYEIELQNGIEVGRTPIQTVRISEPVSATVIVGTKVVDPSSNVAIGQSLAAQRGWVDGEWQCLYSLWQRESGWNHQAMNPSSGAFGIPQSLPGNKMATAGPDWQTNPSTQISWGLTYITARYGTPCAAWAHSEAVGWY